MRLQCWASCGGRSRSERQPKATEVPIEVPHDRWEREQKNPAGNPAGVKRGGKAFTLQPWAKVKRLSVT